MAATRSQRDAVIVVLRQLGHTTPRAGEWERTYRALQARARHALDQLGALEPQGG